jgi:hypothetical protein
MATFSKTMMAAGFGFLSVAGVIAGNHAYAAQGAGVSNGFVELAQSESDNPAGHCPGNLNPGDICREGVCSNGERTVYRCDANRDCKQAGKEACNDNGSSSKQPEPEQ